MKSFVVAACALVTLSGAYTIEAADRAALAGSYYLTGVREVGSQLNLKPDGRYEWMMAYGNQDFVSSGTWSVIEEEVTLEAELQKENRALFHYETSNPDRPWDADAEQTMRIYQYNLERGRILAQYPFLDTADYASSPQLNKPELSATELEKAAHAAVKELAAATTTLEQAAQVAVKNSVSQEQAVAAMDRFQKAWLSVKETHWAARLPIPLRPEPVFPPQCTLPSAPTADSGAPDTWKRGTAVVVGDEQAGMRFGSILVEFVYGDGHSETRVTGRNGIAAVPRHTTAPLVEIVLSPIEGVRNAETLPVPVTNSSEGNVFMVRLDASGLAEPIFRHLHLAVEDGALRTQEFGGRYVRN